jgi:hypothetical protein
MLRLDRSKPFGKVVPPYQTDNMDRPAVADQDGKLFDQYGYEIIPGVPGPPPEELSETAPAADPGSTNSAADLLGQADALPFPAFRARARKILGDRCPASKDGIIVALKRAVANPDAATPSSNQAAPAAAKDQKASAVDLAAWGRGQKNYLFAEVRKAIRERLNRVVSTTEDAVDALIDAKVISAATARKG